MISFIALRYSALIRNSSQTLGCINSLLNFLLKISMVVFLLGVQFNWM